MIQNKRRLISLESDIVEDVFNKTGGRYTRNQINDVLISSISYVHYLCSIGDAVVVNVPFLGYMVCNAQKMKSRISVIQKIKEKKGYLSEQLQMELASIESKIALIEELKKSGKLKRGDGLIKSIKDGVKYLKRGFGFNGIEDFQNKQFK